MNALAWNCQGLGSPGKIRFLQDITRNEKLTFIFLSETISSYAKMEELRNKLGFEGFSAVEPQGRSGGIAMFWRNSEEVNLRSFSRSYIDVIVNKIGSESWRLTGIYGEPARTDRHKTWDLLRNLSRDANLPWCLIGDFNNVTSQTDKKGGPPYPNNLIDGFNACLRDTELCDLDITGHQFTWERGRDTDHWTEIRLDRVLANHQWLNMFTLAKVYNLEGSPSDHSPLLIVPEVHSRGNRKRQFRFENAWLTEPMCFQIIKECWEGEENSNVMQKIKSCSASLEVWGKEITSCFNKRIKECKKKLRQLRGKRDPQSIAEYEEAKNQLFLVLDQKEIFWRQRSKQLWLQAGEKNTKYFHASCTKRKRNNHIQKLKNDDGNWVEWNTGLQEMIQDYFQHLFTEEQNSGEEVLNCISRSISEQQNQVLLDEVSAEEVQEAVHHMHPDKAPGPDGMTPAFFQKNWKLVGPEVVQLVRDFFATGELRENINATNIVLIPKTKSPTVLTELRPIALCNVIMKIITKVIANRLKKVLDSVISDTQSAFLPGRLISDNIMISFEVMHYLKKKKFGKEGYMALKLDMSKAYDRIEWNFLREILLKLGFDSWWTYLILQCVSSVEYRITHGDFEMGPIKPSRGLRQGDPLSPYLFIICAEGLTALIRQYESKKWLQGIKICRKAPQISHMLFADDSYLYCKAETGEARRVLELLAIYERASGQRINRGKSTVFFSSNVIQYNKEAICQVLQIPEADSNSKYLGLPSILGRNKSVIFSYLKDKVKNSILNWTEKKVSRAAKETLIKTVAQALPTYAMMVFLLPTELIRDIEKLMSKFFWNTSQTNNSKITWMAWERMSKHKHAGGLGFKSLRDVNLAMLGKQCWRLITNPDSLVARVYKAKYYADTEFMEAKLGSSPSFIWRSVLEAKRVISIGASWRIGTGKEIKILEQPWLNNWENPYISTISPSLADQTVASLFKTGTKEWDLEVISDIFDVRDQQCIVNTKVEQELEKDILSWKLEPSGNYSVKSTYKLLQEQKGAWNITANNEFWKNLWTIKAPPKALNLVWRASSYCLPTKTMLQTKHVPVDNMCPVCNEGAETIFHGLVQCKTAALCWKIHNPNINTESEMEFTEWLITVLKEQSKQTSAKIITLCWSIWRARNDLVWSQKTWTSMKIVAKAWEYLSQWTVAQDRNLGVPLQPPSIGDGAIYWAKPQHNAVKITVDAAIFEDQGASGLGAIVRNHDGHLILAKTRCFNEVMDPLLAEAIAVREALSWTKEMSWNTSIIESDCLVVVQLIRSATSMRSRLGKVIEDCRGLIQELNNITLYFIRRSANMSAHELAHVSHMYPDRIFDWRSAPVNVKNCILHDLKE